jgi:hypothetical protein
MWRVNHLSSNRLLVFMSYARFSSNAFRSHVYVYESRDHYQIHVAANERDVDRSKLPEEPERGDDNFGEKYIKYLREVMDLIRDADIGPVGGPMDGESFTEATAESALERLIEIREAGYNVPEEATNRLRQEAQQ